MAKITPLQARHIVANHPDAAEFRKPGGAPRKYAFRYKLLNPNGRHISISTKDSGDPEAKGPAAGVTVYINAISRANERFPLEEVERHFPGVSVTKTYPRGYKGATGDKGLSSAAASCETLDPRNHDVLRLSVEDEAAFSRLLAWYAGDKQFVAA